MIDSARENDRRSGENQHEPEIKPFYTMGGERLKDSVARAVWELRIGKGIPYDLAVEFSNSLAAVIAGDGAAIYERGDAAELFRGRTLYAVSERLIPSTSPLYAGQMI